MGLRNLGATVGGSHNRLNVCFNKWIRDMAGTNMFMCEVREKRLTNKQQPERLENVESFGNAF